MTAHQAQKRLFTETLFKVTTIWKPPPQMSFNSSTDSDAQNNPRPKTLRQACFTIQNFTDCSKTYRTVYHILYGIFTGPGQHPIGQYDFFGAVYERNRGC